MEKMGVSQDHDRLLFIPPGHLCPLAMFWVYAKMRKNLFSRVPVEIQTILLFHC